MENKSRLCDILGVPPGQPFYVLDTPNSDGTCYGPYIINDGGYVTVCGISDCAEDIAGDILCSAINHPELVTQSLAPNVVTSSAFDGLKRAFGVNYISRADDGSIDLWRDRPKFDCVFRGYMGDDYAGSINLPIERIPHFNPGDLVSLDNARRCDKIETHDIVEQEAHDEESV